MRHPRTFAIRALALVGSLVLTPIADSAPASGPAGARADSGPLISDSDPVELCVFAIDSLQAWTRANADPAVRSGQFRVQLVRWWCAYGVLPGEEGS